MPPVRPCRVADCGVVLWCGVVWLLRRERERDDNDPRGVLHHASFYSPTYHVCLPSLARPGHGACTHVPRTNTIEEPCPHGVVSSSRHFCSDPQPSLFFSLPVRTVQRRAHMQQADRCRPTYMLSRRRPVQQQYHEQVRTWLFVDDCPAPDRGRTSLSKRSVMASTTRCAY